MKISVIIPALNEERALPSTLTQISRLGFDEVIVVDGGSTDKTREVAATLEVGGGRREAKAMEVGGSRLEAGVSGLAPQSSGLSPRQLPADSQVPSTQHSALSPVRLLTSSPGRARQMNAGADGATGDALLFLHADTRLPLDAKTRIEQALRSDVCVGGRFDVRFEPDTGLAWVISRMMNLRSRLSGIATGDQAIFARRSVFEALGGFADVPLMEDVDFSRRLKRQGPTAALRAQAITSYRRWQFCGPVRTVLLMWALRFLYWIGVSPHRLKALYNDER